MNVASEPTSLRGRDLLSIADLERDEVLRIFDLASELKLLFYVSVIACLFLPWGIAPPDGNAGAIAVGAASYVAKLAAGAVLLAVFETSIAKMRVFRVPAFLGAALMLGLLGTLLLFVSGSL